MQIQRFGIEIRRVGNLDNLFKDVDMVLSRNNVPINSVNTDIQKGAIAHALQKMIKVDGWFDICTVDRCIDICQVVISSERYKVYRALHCIHWNEMDPDYRNLIIAMILDDFRGILNYQSNK